MHAILDRSASSLTDAEVIETHNHAEMMKRPHLWPHYPMLPLRYRDRPLAAPNALGMMIAEIPALRTAVLTGPAPMIGLYDHAEQYNTPEDIAAAGWEVD